VDRRDVESAVHARKELGPGYDDEIVDSLLAKIDRRLEERQARQPAEAHEHRGMSLAGFSLILGIPITAIAGSQAGLAGIVVVWIGIVLVNFAHAARHR
jgi:hypothetical protein